MLNLTSSVESCMVGLTQKGFLTQKPKVTTENSLKLKLPN